MKRISNAFKWLGIVGGLAVWGWLGFAVFNSPRPSKADTLSIPNSFSVGQVADPNAVNANFDAIKNVINGKIDNDNWDTAGPDLTCANLDVTAACAGSAFITDGSIVNADVNASAAIVGSKLDLANDIVTGDIVDGTIGTADLAAATIAALDNQVFATGNNPSDVTGLNCANTWTDITGASWNVTAFGGTIAVIFHSNVDGNSGSIVRLSLRLVIDGTNQTTVPASATVGVTGGLLMSLNSFKQVSSGTRTIKVQCNDNDADTVNFSGMEVTIMEL